MAETQYPPYQQRVVEERDQLQDRLGKLDEFVETSEVFRKLSHQEQALLKNQSDAMHDYLTILNSRIGMFHPAIRV